MKSLKLSGNRPLSILRKSSAIVAPLAPVIDAHTLQQALYPGIAAVANGNAGPNPNANGSLLPTPSESRATTPSFGKREPNEISFLAAFDKLLICHNSWEECTSCGSSVEILTSERTLIMKGAKGGFCFHQNFEIFHVLTNELVILIEIEDRTWSCTVPDTIQIYAPPGRSLGFIDRFSACGSDSFFEIRNAAGDSIYTVEPTLKCFGPNYYPVISSESASAKVAELEAGFSCSCSLTEGGGPRLNVRFLQNLPPSRRALVIGLALLVDMVECSRRQRVA